MCVQSGIHAAHRSAETEEGPARDTIRLGLELEDAANISGNVGHGGGGRQGAAQNGLRQHFLCWMSSPRETEKIPLCGAREMKMSWELTIMRVTRERRVDSSLRLSPFGVL